MNSRKPVVAEPEDWHLHRSGNERGMDEPPESAPTDIDF